MSDKKWMKWEMTFKRMMLYLRKILVHVNLKSNHQVETVEADVE